MEGKAMSESRKSGWGSVRELREGVWQLRFPSLKPTGQPGPRRSRTVHGTRADAERALFVERERYDSRAASAARRRIAEMAEDEARRDLRADAARPPAGGSGSSAAKKAGRPRSDAGAPPLGRVWDESYWPHALGTGLSPLTLQDYEKTWRLYVEPHLGHMPITEVTHADAQALMSALTHRTAQKACSVLRIVFNHAQYEGIISRAENIMADRYRMPPKAKRKVKAPGEVYTADELDAILADARGEVFEAVAIVSGKGGARLAEACGVRCEEMGFSRDDAGELWCEIAILRNVVRVDGEPLVKDVKTPKSKRPVFVREPWSERLLELVDERGGEGWLTDDGFGRPLTSKELSPVWRRWFLGRSHRYVAMLYLRDSYATDLHRKGLDPSRISQILGHSQRSSMLYDHYDRPQAEVIRESLSGRPAPRAETPDMRERLAGKLTEDEMAILSSLLAKLREEP
jgi:hypothetical protein